jgi:hypothetical protein
VHGAKSVYNALSMLVVQRIRATRERVTVKPSRHRALDVAGVRVGWRPCRALI